MTTSGSRRQFLRAATGVSAVGIAGLSGCISSLTGGNSDGNTVEYWEYFHSQSEVAKQLMEDSVEEFEGEHDVSFQMNWASWDDINGGKWKSNIQNGNRPVLYDSTNSLNGQFIDPGWVKPVDEYIDRLDDEAVENAKWAFDLAESCYRGFDADLYEIPIGLEVGSPFVARTDHFEEAGLSIEDDFPPQDYQHLVEVATQLQENGPGDYGFQIYGEQGDVTDEAVSTWTTSAGGYDGLYLNEDWSDVNYDNDVWKGALSDWVNAYHEHDLSSQKSPTASDEGVSQMLIQGTVSMAQLSTKDFGLFRSRGKDLLESGKLRFAPSWEGQAGNRGEFFTQCVAILRPPDRADEQQWKKREEKAIQWINKLLSKDFQKQVPKSLATLPVREDVWSGLKGDDAFGDSNFVGALETTVENMEHGWSSHPDMNAIQYDIAGPLFQEAVRGKITPEEACDRTAKQIREQVDF